MLLTQSFAGEYEGGLYPASANSSGQSPTALIELDGTGSENPDGGTLTYEWKQIEGPRVELSDPQAAKPYFRTGKPGLYRFQLVVSANSMASEPFIVEVMIEHDNQPPVANAPHELSGEVGKLLEIDGTASFDPEGENLTYRWRSLTKGLEIPLSSQGMPVLSLEPTLDGVFEVELLVSDGQLVSAPAIIRLMIKPKPRPPIARAKAIPREIPSAPQSEQAMAPPSDSRPVARIEGPAVAKLGDRLMLDARGSRTTKGTKLEYMWRQKSGPFVGGFELIYDGAAERFEPPRAGDYEFELIVSDGMFESEPALHKIKVVNESDPPVAVVVAPTRAVPGALVKLDATQSYDLEGSPLIYRWRQTGGPKVTRYLIDESIGDAAPAFHPPNAGIYSFELIVSNGRLQSKPIEIDIEVGDTRRPPKLGISGPEVANTGDSLVLAANAENIEGRNIVYAWRQVEGPMAALPQTNGPRAQVAASVPGRYIFDLSALEDGNVVATARRTLEIFSPPPGRVPANVSQHPPIQPPAQRSVPELTPLLDMPALPSVAQPILPTTPALFPSDPTAMRPAAQIHPSTLGGGDFSFIDPDSLLPMAQ